MDRIDAAFVERLAAISRGAPPAHRAGPAPVGAAPPSDLPGGDLAAAIVRSGCRVVALARAGGVGRLDALATAITAALEARGRSAAMVQGTILSAGHDERTARADVVLVTGGEWFPAGPIDRRRLVRAACGCDGVILATPTGLPCPARTAALESLGILVVATVSAASISLSDGGRAA